MKTFKFKWLLLSVILSIASINTMWAANTYKITGQLTGTAWDTWKDMTVSTDGFYEYYATSGDSRCKINTSASYTGAIGIGNKTALFNGTDISNTWADGESGNICFYDASTFYILIYYANTCINTTSNPIVCASSTLPQEKFYVAGDDSWMAKAWTTTDDDNLMSRDGNIYSKTISSVSAGNDTHKLKVSTYNWKNSWGYSDYSAATHPNIVGSVTNDDGNIVFKPAMEGDVTVSFNTSTKKVSIVCQAPEITLEDNGGSGGSGTQNTYYGEATSSVTVPTKTGYNFLGYWSDDATPVQVINSSGAWIKNVSGYTNNESTAQWVVRADHEFTAHWEAQTYNITYKDEGNVTYSGSNGGSLPSTYTYGTGIISLTDGVRSGYRFDGWFDNSSCTGSAVTSISTTATGDKIFYAKWTENPGGTVTLTAGTGGQVSKNGSSWGSSTSYTGIKSTTPLNIYAQANTGYTFSAWSKTSGSGEITSTSSASTTFTPVADADAALTANFSETMSSLSTSCSYDAGDPSYSAPTVSGSATTVGYSTTRSITAASASTGYTFAGWTITNGARTDGGGDKATTITVRSNGDGAAVSVEAKYDEVLDTDWHLLGATTPFGGWSSSSSNMLQKASGSSTGSVASITINVSALPSAEEYTFKLYNETTGKWRTNAGYWVTRANNNPTLSTEGGTDNELIFKPDVVGNYTFTLDYSSANPVLTVTFPTTYQVHYDVGTVKGASNNPSAQDDESNAISDGDYVLSGTEVTFTAEEAATGYTWEGWYDAATTSGNKLSTDDDLTYTTTISAATTVYAVYTENSYTVTVNAGSGGKVSYDGGSASSSCSASAGVVTESATISAIPNAGYAFVGWTNVDNEHHITAFDADWNSTNKGWDLVVKADAATTITANFEPRFALVGAIVADGNPEGGMPGWDLEDAVAFSYSTGTYTLSRTLTSPNTGYAFKVIDRRAETWIWRGYSDEENNLAVDNTTTYTLTEDGGNNVYFDSRGVGNYTFTVVEETITGVVYPKVKIQDGANSHVVTWGYVSDNGQEGGTITSVVDGEATPNSIASGNYVKDGGSITVTAAVTPGYRFIDFRTSSTYGGGSQLSTSNPYTVASVDDDMDIYAHFAENLCTVTITTADASKGSITVGGEDFDWGSTTQVGVYNYKSLVVTPAAGYYFSGWTLSDTPDFTVGATGESGSSTNLTGLGGMHGSTGTLTANFKELEKIYFRNLSTMDDGAWANVYVYFGVDWNGSENAVSNANAAYKVAMTQVGASDVYWAYVPRAFTSSSGTAIAFSNQSVSTSTAINTGLAATRNDYNKALQMYVPSVTWANHGAHYYNDGYWRNYPVKVATGAGYYLQTTRGTNLVEFKGQADNSDKIECTVRVDQSNTDKTFHIKSAGGVYYEPYNYSTSTYPKISSSAPTMTMKSGDTDGLTVTLTSEGIYTFIIDQSSDIMELTVGYPVSIGDYRLKHTYDDGSAKTTYSDVIKSGDAAEGQTISMYLSTAGTESLVLQKCTAIVAGVPAWDAGNDTNLSGVLTTVGTNYGVYQFDVAVSGDKVASAPTATKYTGPYYIKTDGATGGWATYKQNSMDENTLNYDTDHPEKSFNYYYCKYYNYAGTNLKCVIANDYCNALTDTLVGDAVIGIENQTTPSAASVRFSYNTYTNEIKRSYLGASVNSDFLRILGNTAAGKPHIYDKAETTYDDSHADSYITFEDKQNWRYEIDVKADVNARAKLTATFNGQTQYFWGHAGEVGEEWDDENTEELFGGTSGTYGLTLVYDFKTNKLITAWKPTGTINSDLSLKSDIFLLREHQESPTTITFGLKDASNYASLTDVKTVYSVLRLNRWKLNNRAHPEDLDTDHCDGGESDYTTYHAELEVNQDDEDGKWLPQAERELYFISFPFDVKMSDIISFGNYYDTWGIMYYDGKGRAKSGYWVDSESNWKYFTPEEFATETLNAYEGYLIGIDLSAMAYNNTSFWTNNSSEVDIYFPSKTAVSTITQKAVTVTIDTVGYKCSINRDFGGSDGDRRIKDSHWHCIGVPSYADLTHAINNGAPADASWSNTSLLYLYEWDSSKNEHSIKKSSEFNFKAMYAYLVQYAGTTLTWAASSATGPTSIVARRMKTEELCDRQFNLQLMQSGKEADHTYIRLSDDEEVTTGFEFNHDVSKMMLSGANIYTLIGKEQAAANSLPLNLEQTTVVPVGVKIATNGDYTFSISEGTQGVGVTLIDNETGTRTSLSALDYEISLEAGTYDERFLLEISPIKNTPTSIEETTGDGLQVTNARKVMIDGLLYIVKDGVIYDARGAVVK